MTNGFRFALSGAHSNLVLPRIRSFALTFVLQFVFVLNAGFRFALNGARSGFRFTLSGALPTLCFYTQRWISFSSQWRPQ